MAFIALFVGVRLFHHSPAPAVRSSRTQDSNQADAEFGRSFAEPRCSVLGNTDGLVAFSYTSGANGITAPGRTLATFKPGGHWTRSLLPNADGTKLYVGVGSSSTIAENGLEAAQGRAAIFEVDLAGGGSRIFASGLCNAVGMVRKPLTGALWAVVNERDGLSDETPPDYLTSVRDGGFYG